MGLLADLFGGDLIDSRGEVIVGAFGQLGLGRAEESGVRSCMRAGVGVSQFQVRDDGHLFFEWRERAQNR